MILSDEQFEGVAEFVKELNSAKVGIIFKGVGFIEGDIVTVISRESAEVFKGKIIDIKKVKERTIYGVDAYINTFVLDMSTDYSSCLKDICVEDILDIQKVKAEELNNE